MTNPRHLMEHNDSQADHVIGQALVYMEAYDRAHWVQNHTLTIHIRY